MQSLTGWRFDSSRQLQLLPVVNVLWTCCIKIVGLFPARVKAHRLCTCFLYPNDSMHVLISVADVFVT